MTENRQVWQNCTTDLLSLKVRVSLSFYISYACLGSSLVLGQSLSESLLRCWMLSERRRIRETVQPCEYHCRSKRLSKSSSITCLGALLMLCHRTLSQSVRRPCYHQYHHFLRLLCSVCGSHWALFTVMWQPNHVTDGIAVGAVSK